MTALPSSLAPAEPLARAVYETGLASTLDSGPDTPATDRHRRGRSQRAERRVSAPTSGGPPLRMRFATVPETGHE